MYLFLVVQAVHKMLIDSYDLALGADGLDAHVWPDAHFAPTATFAFLRFACFPLVVLNSFSKSDKYAIYSHW